MCPEAFTHGTESQRVRRLGVMKILGPLLGSALATFLLACDGDSCFVRGSRVLTPKGWRPIESLAEGDEVTSFDPDRGAVAVRRIRKIMQRTVERVVRVQAGEIAIAGVSPEHPFWDATTRSFLPVASLSLDTRLLVLLPGAREPRELQVDAVALLPSAGRVEVWNLEVDGEEHTYFVEGILVHNKSTSTGGGYGGEGGASLQTTASSSSTAGGEGGGDGGAGGAGDGGAGGAGDGGAGGAGGSGG
jgi:hypothetical protein